MEIIKSKFDTETEYRLAQQYVVVSREGEDMKIPFRQIPNVMKVFKQEIQSELMEIFELKCPTTPCPICGKPVRRKGQTKYCSAECREEGNRRNNRKNYFKNKPSLERNCPVCGKTFTPLNGKIIYCSDDCRRRAAAMNLSSKGEKLKRKPKKDPMILVRLNQEARSKGLSYGQMQAQKYIAQMKGVLE